MLLYFSARSMFHGRRNWCGRGKKGPSFAEKNVLASLAGVEVLNADGKADFVLNLTGDLDLSTADFLL